MLHHRLRHRALPLIWVALLLLTAFAVSALAAPPEGKGPPEGHGPGTEGAGSNLSFPVIFTDGAVSLPAPGTALFTGTFYVWDVATAAFVDGATLDLELADCENVAPDTGTYQCYFGQRAEGNVWVADALTATTPLAVDYIDWGDNLESKDWTTGSPVRVETGLYQELDDPLDDAGLTGLLTGYNMTHMFGQGPDEMWATDTMTYDSSRTLVYTAAARLTIQPLSLACQNTAVWDATGHGWMVPDPDTGEPTATFCGSEPVFDDSVYGVTQEGPGGYTPEINISGKIIYGYNWTVRIAGEYRLTFSIDPAYPGRPLASFDDGTAILEPVEGEATVTEEEAGGNVARIHPDDDLTFIDVTITGRSSGGRKPR
jgi:hypothetical protein